MSSKSHAVLTMVQVLSGIGHAWQHEFTYCELWGSTLRAEDGVLLKQYRL